MQSIYYYSVIWFVCFANAVSVPASATTTTTTTTTFNDTSPGNSTTELVNNDDPIAEGNTSSPTRKPAVYDVTTTSPPLIHYIAAAGPTTKTLHKLPNTGMANGTKTSMSPMSDQKGGKNGASVINLRVAWASVLTLITFGVNFS